MSMDSLGFKKVPWLGVCLVLLLPFFFVGGPGAYTPTVVSIAWDFGHYIFFSLFAWWCFHSGLIKNYKQSIWGALVVFVVGGAIEILQSKTGRDGNWGDIWRDLAGYGLGCIFAGSNLKNLRWAVLPSLFIIAPNLEELGFAAAATVRAYNVFPKIQGGYESPFDLYPLKLHLARVPTNASEGEFALEVKLSTALYSGVNIRPLVRNWAGYQTLHFDVFNPDDKPLTLSIRINDVAHDLGDNEMSDRFNRRLQLVPGLNHYVIALSEIESAPKKRKMKMDEIISMMIFTSKLPAPRRIYLDNVHLE